MLFWPILIIAIAILVLIFSNGTGSGLAGGEQTDMRIVYLAVLAAGIAIAGLSRVLLHGGRRTMVTSAVWLGAIGGLITAFVFRDEAATLITGLRAELVPHVAMTRALGEEELRRDWDGHFSARTEVNGVDLNLLIDTGASMVLIPYEDAVRIGIDPRKLEYSIPVTTANGRSSVAPIELSSIRINSIAVFDVPAAVAKPGRIKTGLLGISFLDRLAEVSFQGNRLVLRQYIPIDEASR